ncbi:arylsulfatase [Flexithrix dorotheae]|uniref:arylsulfatase n=1 Tax=Flexithrix dorotheae TaxID=70993 RepID=UPI00036F8617|nr:arylsulfatase [Flexithrix dorotheae]
MKLKNTFLIILFLIQVNASFGQKQEKQFDSKPNIILFLADDMGWGDAGCYGQEKIKTPNLDKMAKNGLRFTNAYTVSPVCAPARSGLIEGLHSGHTLVRNNKSREGKNVSFSKENYTMAEMLKEAGYSTGLFGKWGLADAGTDGIPTKQGFDEFYGFLDQRKAHYYYPDSLWHNEELIDVPLSEEKQYSSADWYLDKAKDFIKKEKDGPFFAYIPTQLPHLYMPYRPMDCYKDKPWPEGDKRWATMISTIDQQMGELVELIDSLGISENTIILFLSDNGGGNGQRIYYHDVRFFKSNANFRGMKRDLFEGGIRVPFIIQWEGTIKKGISDEPVAYYDLMSTLGELAGNIPQNTDGESLVKLFTGISNKLNREYLYWEFPDIASPNSKFAVRKGKWKGVKEWMGAPLQIYNLEEDPEELYNWHYERQDLVEEFEAIMKKEHEPSKYWPLRNE